MKIDTCKAPWVYLMGLCTIEAKTPIGSKLVFEKWINGNYDSDAMLIAVNQIDTDKTVDEAKADAMDNKTFLRRIAKLLKALRLNLAACAILLRTTKRNS
ncbi:MAG: hypothetical protein IJL81_06935 [Clostridia bacterium]|nr:hypothetical protein [Clostridia bacterium]